MEIVRTGVILRTVKYDECVAFYRDLFGLRALFQEQRGDFALTCFAFGDSYLMVETGGPEHAPGDSFAEAAAKLRFNVSDIEEALAAVRAYGIDAEVSRSDWGATINISDPDGNPVGIRDEATFRDQEEGRG